MTVSLTHHHRNTTKVEHKAFKSKHATKSAIRDANKGKVEGEERGRRRTPHQQVMSKLQRRNQAKQLRVNHKTKQDAELDIFRGADGAPKHVAVVPLSKEVDVSRAISEMLDGVDIQQSTQATGTVKVRVERYSRNVIFMPSTMETFNAMDICKLADLIVFVLSPIEGIDDEAHALLKVIEGQGVTTALFATQDMKKYVPEKKQHQQLSNLKAEAEYYFPDLEKVALLDNKNECGQVIRKICTSTTKGIRWRDARTWMLLENTTWDHAPSDSIDANVTVSGIVRGRALNPDRLVHIPGWGEYQIDHIAEIPARVHKKKEDEMTMETDRKQVIPTTEQDDLAELAPEEVEMVNGDVEPRVQQRGVLLDDHHYFSDDMSHIPAKPKKLPTGTSNYQSAWYLEDVDDSDDNEVDQDMQEVEQQLNDTKLHPEDGDVAPREDAMTEAPQTEYPETEMHIDATHEQEAAQLAEYRANRKRDRDAEEDAEFPDEIELHPNVLARERLAKYRGLKSLRTSVWNTEEDTPYQPADYDRLLQVPDYKKSFNSVAKNSLIGPIAAGTRVEITLKSVPLALQQTHPVAPCLFSLLKHEHKHTVNNLSVSLLSTIERPVKSKDELLLQIGHRRFYINPVFSAAGNTPNNVHKFERFLHPGRSAIASFTGPLTWDSVPCLAFRQSSENGKLELVGTATTMPPSTQRIIAKRVILTGHPYKIHKKLVTIRYMFFNREDVEWFKALPLWTKRGRQGFVKEPLGTHGYFKATFDNGAGKVNGMDAVGISLYKRIWPRPCRRAD